MKKLLIWLGLLGAWTAPAAITVTPGGGGTDSNTVYNIALVAANAVGGATNGISQATASAMMADGTNSFAGDGLGVTNVVSGGALTNVGNYQRYSVKTYGAVGDGTTDDSAAIQAAATVTSATSAAAIGELFFPVGTYLLDSANIHINGAYGVDVPGTSLDSGYWKILGQNAKIVSEVDTNAIEFVNGMRLGAVQDLVLQGTNVNRSPVGNHVGFAFNGPGGQVTANDLVAAQFTAGFLVKDITAFSSRSLMAISNFVGVAVGFKPDHVQLNVRPQFNYYGLFINYTNSQFTNYVDGGGAIISGVFGYNTKAIVIPKGNVLLRDVYFEGNGMSVQLGLEDANAYEASYPGSESGPSGSAPVVSVSGFEGTAQDFHVYRTSTLRFDNTITFAGSKVVLKNSLANQSVIESDAELIVVKSDLSELTIGKGYRYVAGSVVPISGMSHTNLTDLTIGDRHSTTNYAVNTNVLIITACETNAFNNTWYWNAARYSYTNATVTTHAFTWFAGDLFLTNAAHSSDSDFVFGGSPFDEATGVAGDWYFGPDGSGGTSAMESIYATRFPVAVADYDDASISTNKMDAVAYAAFIGGSSPGGDSYIFTNAAAGGLRFTNEFGLGAFTGTAAGYLTATGVNFTLSSSAVGVYGYDTIFYAGTSIMELATGTLMDGTGNPALQPQSRALVGNWNAQGNLDVDGDFNSDGTSRFTDVIVTNFFTGVTNATGLGTDADGKLISVPNGPSIVGAIISGANINSGAPRYVTPAAATYSSTTEGTAAIPCVGGTWSNLNFKVVATLQIGTNFTVTLWTNGVASHLAGTVVGSGTGIYSASNYTASVYVTNNTPISFAVTTTSVSSVAPTVLITAAVATE